MADVQKQLQALSEDYQNLQKELDTTVSASEKLDSQKTENLSVQKEFKTLAEDANIYKLVGPVLLKQDKSEATMAVDGRLEYIEGEIKRVEKQIQDIQEKSEKKKVEIIAIQTQAQQQQQQQQAAA
ncbi:Prefoldin beta-like protein [Aulographum hederae CBS 113979]|uniref:Prefoldin beta-like protein n=1 Tax=Aulographum hederae CBS 113979 TaxID=1176131 RepID=A0A6G1GSX2_9PEZI|nr:Prefoldin beta-like protein [Aulographum hederae CBS 113979]